MIRPRTRVLGTVFMVMAVSVGAIAFAGCSDGAGLSTPVALGGAAATSGGAAGSASTSAGAAGVSVGGATGAAGAGAAGGGAADAGTGGAPSGGGSPGVAGANGASGAGAGTMTGRPSGPSAGCKAPLPQDPIQKAVQHDLMVNVAAKYQPTYVPRKYYTTLPKDWDPAKAYPMIFYGQGCGQTVSESGPFTNGHFLSEVLYVQLIPATVTGATVVPPNGSPGCFQAGREGLANSPDGPYFDQTLAEVEKAYCVDTGKVYVAGWSSGAWLANYLACARGNVITGTASGSGGLQHDHGTCTGGAAVMIMPGDAASTMQDGFDIGAGPARDTFLAANGCASTSKDVMFGTATCQLYDGCKTPVTWCNAGGGHGGPLGFIAESSWAFWKP